MSKTEQINTTPKKRITAFIEILTKSGLIGNKEISEEKIREAKRKKQEKMYHNTHKLLQNYRTLAWLLESFPEVIAEEIEQRFETIDELIEKLDFDMAYGNKKLEERMDSIKKTRFIVDKINEAVSLIKKSPDDGERLYNVLYLTYIAPEKLSHFDLLYRLDVSTRHYYRLREKAVNKVSQRLWSAPDKETDYWIEILMVLQES